MQDYNEDGMLSLSEFSDLIDAFGNQVASSKVHTSVIILHLMFSRYLLFVNYFLSKLSLICLCTCFLNFDSDLLPSIFRFYTLYKPVKSWLLVFRTSNLVILNSQSSLQACVGLVVEIMNLYPVNIEWSYNVKTSYTYIQVLLYHQYIIFQQKEELFKAADKNGDDVVSMDELASLLTFQQEQ